MRRLAVTVVLAASFLFALPAPAHAWWHWLDELTGPGPFTGPDLQWRLVCVNDPAPAMVARKELEKAQGDAWRKHVDDVLRELAAQRNQPNQPIRNLELSLLPPKTFTEKEVIDKTKEIRKRIDPGDGVLRSIDSLKGPAGATVRSNAAAAFGLLGCPLQQDKNPIASLNFRLAWLWSIHNHLTYENGKDAPRVYLWQPEVSFSVFVDHRKSVELMTGAGVSHFYGEGFDSFSRFYWKPLGLTISPAALARREASQTTGTDGMIKDGFWSRAARSFTISSAVLYMPKGFTDQDFGAMSNTFKTDREFVGSIAIVFDLSRF